MVKLDQLLEVIIKIIVKSQNKKSELKLTFNKLKLLKKNKFLHIIKKHIQKL